MFRRQPLNLLLAGAFCIAVPSAQATIHLIAKGSLAGTGSDLSGLNGALENGVAANLLGGIGSGLAWAGGSTFIGLPDRGPNATAWAGGAIVDNTTSYVARLQSLQLTLAPSAGALPFTLTPTLTGTTLLYSPTALNYGPVAPSINAPGKNYFSGRSDNFGVGASTNPANARLDPEAVRVSNDGKSVFVSDEYGPYVYQFDRASGQRIKSFALPGNFAIANLNSQGALEISGNTSGRVANKGMEGLAITPDGKKLIGFEQSPLIQDGGDGGRTNRIVTIDIASGATKQFAYDNKVGSKNYNSSEILALNDHEFLVLERGGKGLGDKSSAAIKQVWKVDLSGAEDVSGLSGEAALLAKAPAKSLFLDIRAELNAQGIVDAQIPAKLEGLAYGDDVMVDGKLKHTLYIANDNDFLADVDGQDNPNQWFVFAFDEDDLGGSIFVKQDIAAAVPEPEAYALILAGLGVVVGVARRRSARSRG